MTTFKHLTNSEIIELNNKRKVSGISEGGYTYVVRRVDIYLDTECTKVMNVTDVSFFASEGKAYDYAADMTAMGGDSGSSIKHMYTVGCRYIEL